MNIFKIAIATSLFLSAVAQAQILAENSSSLGVMKQSRKSLEVQTELNILEKLEAARLEDERKRRQDFEALNFSVLNDKTEPSAVSGTNSF